MGGIYLHIPFCKKACHYCNFHFSTSLKQLPNLVASLKKEIVLRNNYLNQPISSLYLGGGTPSLLPPEELSSLFELIKSQFSILSNIEVTLEANPDDIHPSLLNDWRNMGINRLSIGIQSFVQEELSWMNRAHNLDQALTCTQEAKIAGFENLSIDLIYGGPLLSNQQWKENLEQAISLGINHLSCYALTVEEKTALAKNIASQKTLPINAEKQAEQFEILTDTVSKAGYEHYELSNFAKPGFRSKHNSSYWQGVHYLGIGPSAHSFNGKSRQWNVSNNALYIKGMELGQPNFEIEWLSLTQHQNEYVMTSLRTMEGISLLKIATEFGQKALANLELAAKKHLQIGNLIQANQHLLLSQRGKFLADGIAADLFQ